MRLPRGLQTGDVPTGRVVIGDERAALASIANEVTRFTDDLIEQQAQAEYADAISAAESATRDYLDRARQLRINKDTGRPAYETAEADFAVFFSQLENSATKSLSTKRAKNAVNRRLRVYQNQQSAEIRAIARGQRIEAITTHTNAAVERYVDSGEYDAARLAAHNQEEVYSPEAFERLRSFIDSREQADRHQRQVDTFLAQHAEAAQNGRSAEYIRQFRETSSFDDEETRGIIRTMQSQKRQWEAEEQELTAELRLRQGVERELEIHRFQRGIRASTGDHEIEAFVRKYAITDQGRISAFFRERDRHLEAQSVMTSDFLDPTNPKVRSQVDRVLGTAYASRADRIQAAIGVAADRGIASVGLEEFFESGARAQDGFVMAAETYREFREVAPNAYLPLTDDAKAFYSKHATLTRAGMDPVEAANMAWSLVNDSTPQLRADRMAMFDADGIRETITDNIVTSLNDMKGLHLARPFFRPDVTADVPPEMLGDISRIAEAVFLRTGDEMAAEQAVRDNLANAWQITDINDGVKVTFFGDEGKKRAERTLGPQYMKGAPRRGSEFIRKVLEDEIKDRLFWYENKFQTLDPARVELYQPPLPEKDEYGRPVWTLRVNGQALLNDARQVVRWTYEPIPGSETPKQTEPEVTEAGFISLPPGASGVIERPGRSEAEAE